MPTVTIHYGNWAMLRLEEGSAKPEAEEISAEALSTPTEALATQVEEALPQIKRGDRSRKA